MSESGRGNAKTIDEECWARAVWLEEDQEEEGVVPLCWIKGDFVMWPSGGVVTAFKERRQPGDKWHKFKLVKVKCTSASKKTCTDYNETTTAETETESEDEVVVKRKPKKKNYSDYLTGDLHVGVEDNIEISTREVNEHAQNNVLPKPPQKVNKFSKGETSLSVGNDDSQLESASLRFGPALTHSTPILTKNKRERCVSGYVKSSVSPCSPRDSPDSIILPYTSSQSRSRSRSRLSHKSSRKIIHEYSTSPRREGQVLSRSCSRTNNINFDSRSSNRKTPLVERRSRSPKQNRSRSRSWSRPLLSGKNTGVNRRSQSPRSNKQRTTDPRQYKDLSRSRSRSRSRPYRRHSQEPGPYRECSRSRSRSQTVVANTSKRVEKFPMSTERFQRRVLFLLTEIRNERRREQSPTNFDIEQSNDIESVRELEEKLIEDPSYKMQLKVYLKKIGGVDAADHMKKAMLRLFSNGVMAKMNLKGKKNKFPFADTVVYQLIKDCVLSAHQTATESSVINEMRNFLKYAPERTGGGGRKKDI